MDGVPKLCIMFLFCIILGPKIILAHMYHDFVVRSNGGRNSAKCRRTLQDPIIRPKFIRKGYEERVLPYWQQIHHY